MLSNEPVLIGFLVEILGVLAAKYLPGLKLDTNALTAVATILAAVIAGFVRHFVTPVGKVVAPAPPPKVP